LLLEREPNNLQAQSLNTLIEQGIAKGASRCAMLALLTQRGILAWHCLAAQRPSPVSS